MGCGSSSEVCDAWREADLDRDGRIAGPELTRLVEDHPDLWYMLHVNTGIDVTFCQDLTLELILKKWDKDHDDCLSFKEFKCFHKSIVRNPANKLDFFHEMLFAAYDVNHDGELAEVEFDDLLEVWYKKDSIFAGDSRLPRKNDLKAIALRELDKNHDGKFSFAEIKPLLAGTFLREIGERELKIK